MLAVCMDSHFFYMKGYDMSKVELLAPAGNYDAFLGAINAGADAVYLGGSKFGARAYADNFTDEQVCEAIRYAHFHGKKVYMTVNTLIKEKEFGEVYEYILPFYEAGLDGVIIQDLGVFTFLKNSFPNMEMHVSTQMTLTGSGGAKLLKSLGAKRIVPARELTLNEIKQIKEDTGLDIECFIHGAMCYCYSGQCLFSSILGGRSGNRGRCAQPCRLPYYTGNKEQELYPLSLKDMCTISHIPELIESGIDSFKIEGRMKKAEYAAGVTALYRKYIDLYYQNGKEAYQVTKEDMEKLNHLYIRSEIQDGYYYKQNGKDMITLNKPSYQGTDEALLTDIEKKYLKNPEKTKITMQGEFHLGQPAKLTVSMKKDNSVSVTIEGVTLLAAQNRPVTKEEIEKQLLKLGQTSFEVSEKEILCDEGIFMPLKSINELRRNALERLEEKVIEANGYLPHRNDEADKSADMDAAYNKNVYDNNIYDNNIYNMKRGISEDKRQTETFILVRTKEQLDGVIESEIENGFSYRRLYVECDLLEEVGAEYVFEHCRNKEIGAAYPRIIRNKDIKWLENIYQKTKELPFALVRNYETIQFLREKAYQGKMISDYNLYVWNTGAASAMLQLTDGISLPVELNRPEQKEISIAKSVHTEQMLYGYLPLMVTANCINKTLSECNKKGDILYLTDRYHKKFPVLCNCKHCYNEIYNTVPVSLFKYKEQLSGSTNGLRIDFSIEDKKQVKNILSMGGTAMPENYTTGHFKRGVL